MIFKWVRHAFKALAHPLRVQVLDELREGLLNVSELRDRLAVERSTFSQRLAGREIFEVRLVCVQSVLEELRSRA